MKGQSQPTWKPLKWRSFPHDAQNRSSNGFSVNFVFLSYTQITPPYPTSRIFTGIGTSGTLWEQGAESKTRRCWWRSGAGIPSFQRQYEAVIQPLSDAFWVFVNVITLLWHWLEYCERLFIKQLVFFDYVMKNVFVFVPNYCGCRIHSLHPLAEYCGCSCTHCIHGSYAYAMGVGTSGILWVQCAASKTRRCWCSGKQTPRFQ